MTASRRRDRLVYFRISEDEFGEMLRACESKGARSVSDLARLAVQQFIHSEASESQRQMASSIEALNEVVSELKASVQQLVSAGVDPSQPGTGSPDDLLEDACNAATREITTLGDIKGSE